MVPYNYAGKIITALIMGETKLIAGFWDVKDGTASMVGTVVFMAMIIIFEWCVRLVALEGIIVYFLIVSFMEKKSAAIAPNAQKSQTVLTSAVLEYVQEMALSRKENVRSDRAERHLCGFCTWAERSYRLEAERLSLL